MLRWLVLGSMMQALSLVSSSFIEEEHQSWYFLVQTLNFVSLCCAFLLRDVSETKKTSDLTSLSKSETSTSGDAGFSRVFPVKYDNTIQRNPLKPKRQTSDDSATGINMQQPPSPHRSHDVKRAVAASVVLLVLCRVARSWNQTGDKWSHLPDVGDWLVQ